jgi:hypothetical protein
MIQASRSPSKGLRIPWPREALDDASHEAVLNVSTHLAASLGPDCSNSRDMIRHCRTALPMVASYRQY